MGWAVGWKSRPPVSKPGKRGCGFIRLTFPQHGGAGAWYRDRTWRRLAGTGGGAVREIASPVDATLFATIHGAKMPNESPKYNVAISFLAEDVSIAQALYDKLAVGLDVFYGFPLCHWIMAKGEQFASLGVAFSG